MLRTEYIEDIEQFYKDNKDFIDARYEESRPLCNTNRDLEMDFETYQTLIDSNVVTVLSIHFDDEFIGYCSITISPAVLSKGNVDAKVDHLALSEEARAKGYATEVLSEVENLLSEQGVDELGIVLPPTDFHDSFAKAKGYSKTITVHTKKLGS